MLADARHVSQRKTRSPVKKAGFNVVPIIGFELMTYRLQDGTAHQFSPL